MARTLFGHSECSLRNASASLTHIIFCPEMNNLDSRPKKTCRVCTKKEARRPRFISRVRDEEAGSLHLARSFHRRVIDTNGVEPTTPLVPAKL